ncbi:MAG: IS3 family transposase [Lactobacillales bacterium]|jgi:transposase InsO family protein/predicted DNA-binding protein YlxM (UPF0122 family)|nr:IS3 family transposase [Lactobacillales bacterium]
MAISKFSEEEKDKIIKKYFRNTCIRELCDTYKISKSSIYKWIKESKKHYREYRKESITPREYYKMERNLWRFKTENEIFTKSGCGTNSSIDEKIKAIDKLKGQYSVSTICGTLKIQTSTYYYRKIRSPEKRWYDERNDELKPKIRELFELSKERFGSGKIAIKLRKDGIKVSKPHVDKLMKEMGLVCMQSRLRMFNTTNRKCRFRKNRLKQQFDQSAPNVFWVSDVTYILVNNEDYYICTIIELFSRKVLAFEISDINNASLVVSAFTKAFKMRGCPKGLTFHSDQGAQYTSYQFRSLLRDLGVSQSFSSPGSPHDNAVAESFFSIMKRESLSHKWYKDQKELEDDVSEFISFFNSFRPLKKLGNLSPDEYEAQKLR